jgi:integrase
VAPSPKPATLEDATFEKALQRFEQAKKLKANSATVDKYVSHCRLFLKIISDEKTTLKLSEMQASHIQHYRDIITTLPRKVDPSDSRPITEWLQSAGPRMAPRTLFSHVQSVCMFLGWCKDQQYMVNPAFDAILKDLRKKPKPKKIRRRFTSDELEIIFEPNRYCQFKRDSDYWVPLIALFTGAREAEICQLLIQDVILDADTGLWYLDINDESEIKKVKTESSRRHVPIHRCLLEIGLLDYREARIASQETTLFDETRSNRGEFSAFSKRFNRYRCGIGLETNHQRDLDFHSFRHTVQHQLYDIHGCEEYLIKEIIGHERSGDNEGLKTYSEGASLSKKFEVISKLEYSLPYDELKSRTTNVPVKPSAGADRSHK